MAGSFTSFKPWLDWLLTFGIAAAIVGGIRQVISVGEDKLPDHTVTQELSNSSDANSLEQ